MAKNWYFCRRYTYTFIQYDNIRIHVYTQEIRNIGVNLYYKKKESIKEPQKLNLCLCNIHVCVILLTYQ